MGLLMTAPGIEHDLVPLSSIGRRIVEVGYDPPAPHLGKIADESIIASLGGSGVNCDFTRVLA